MGKRIDYRTIAPQAYQAISPLYAYIKECGLDVSIIDMVWLRISQINGCAYCVDLHYRDALAHRVDARKLNSVITWADTPFFTARERAALAWAESLSLVAETHAPDPAYHTANEQFSDRELVDLTYAIALMNALNRLAVGFRMQPDATTQEQAV